MSKFSRKNSYRTVLLAVAVVLIIGQAAFMTGCSSGKTGTAVYVAPGGSDQNSGGSKDDAFKTIQHALDYMADKHGGEILLCGGTYYERISIEKKDSGTETTPLVIKPASQNDKVVLDGSWRKGEAPYSVDPKKYSWEKEVGQLEMINLEDASYIHIEGLEICNNSTPHGSWHAPMGIQIHTSEQGGSTGVEILNNKIHNIDGESWGYRAYDKDDGSYCCDMNGHGIAAYGEGGADQNAISGLVIQGNEVYNNKLGQSESVVVNGNVKNFTIQRNFIHDNDNIGIDVIGGEGTSGTMKVDCARDGLVEGNVSINNAADINQTYDNGGGCDGIYVDGGKDTVIQDNYVVGSDYAFEIGTENDPPFPHASGITATNNIFVNGAEAGMIIGGTYGAKGNTIKNNTVYSPAPYELNRNRTKDAPNNLTNNIFATPATAFNWPAATDKKTLDAKGFVFDGNVYYGGSAPKPSIHENAYVPGASPFVSSTNGEFQKAADSKLDGKGADIDAMKTAMDKGGFLMNGASLYDIAKANYAARTAAQPAADRVKAAINKAKGTPSSPIKTTAVGSNLCTYLAEKSGGPAGTIVGMKHVGETYGGGDACENSIENGAGKYFGYVQIGRGADGQLQPDKIKAAKTLDNIRMYYKVPYTYTVAGKTYTSWLVHQINNVCVTFCAD